MLGGVPHCGLASTAAGLMRVFYPSSIVGMRLRTCSVYWVWVSSNAVTMRVMRSR